ncbi:MAG: hypothetical protein HRU25_03475 [Psychrobium sp.]|nr:hypothetical protein [Psychrobium sp.]
MRKSFNGLSAMVKSVMQQNSISGDRFVSFACERSLRVYLDNPAVPMDTNALERGLRVIPMGKKKLDVLLDGSGC